MKRYAINELMYLTLTGDERLCLASDVDARIAEHSKDWEDAAIERVAHIKRIAELEQALRDVRDHGCNECYECVTRINKLGL